MPRAVAQSTVLVSVHRQRRVAVPDLHPVQPQPFALQLVVAVAQPRIGGDHGVAQRLDHFGLHVVGQVPPGLGRGHPAPAVDDFLFLGLRVVHAGEGLDVLAENARQFLRCRLALGAVLIGQQVQRALDVRAARHRPRNPAPRWFRRTAAPRRRPPRPDRAGTSPARPTADRVSSRGCGRRRACSGQARHWPRTAPPRGHPPAGSVPA